MAIPFFKEMKIGSYLLKKKLTGPEALSAGADAGATFPLQPGLCRLWQDRLSERYPQPPHVGAGMLGCRRGVRRADGCDPGRRAADPQGNRRDRARPGRAQEVRLALHQRAAAREEARPVHAIALPVLLVCISTVSRIITTRPCRRKACSTAPSSAIKAAKARGFAVNVNATIFDGHAAEDIAKFLDYTVELGVGVSMSPGYAYERAPDQEHFLNRTKTKKLFRDVFALGKGKKWNIMPFRPVPGLPRRQPGIRVQAVGHARTQHLRLAEALLPAR